MRFHTCLPGNRQSHREEPVKELSIMGALEKSSRHRIATAKAIPYAGAALDRSGVDFLYRAIGWVNCVKPS